MKKVFVWFEDIFVNFTGLILNAIPWTIILWLFTNKVLIPIFDPCWFYPDRITFIQSLLVILTFHTVIKIIRTGVM